MFGSFDSNTVLALFVGLLIICGVLGGLASLLGRGSALITIGLLAYGLWLLLRKVSLLLLYPGSSQFVKAPIEIERSRGLFHALKTLRQMLNDIYEQLEANQPVPLQDLHSIDCFSKVYAERNIRMMQPFRSSLSVRKLDLLSCFLKLREALYSHHQSEPLFVRMQYASDDAERDLLTFKREVSGIKSICNQIHYHYESFAIPTDSKHEKFFYQFFKEKLYEVRFGFADWFSLWDYEIHRVPSGDEIIESAILKNLKKQSSSQIPNNCVLFCSPNSAYIQSMVVNYSVLFEYYASIGYKTIVWNYRGYGSSTGAPTMAAAQQDAANIASYYQALGYRIKVVHGYSVGGVAAVALPAHLENTAPGCLQLLVLDRSFSNVCTIAEGMGKTFSRLAKCLFYFSDIDLAAIYRQCHIQKLIIWDSFDEVIKQGASLKLGLLEHVYEEHQKNAKRISTLCDLDELELNHNGVWPLSASLIDLFEHSLIRLLGGKNSSYLLDSEDATESSTDQSFTQVSTMGEVFDILAKTSGGGHSLFSDLEKLRKLAAQTPQTLSQQCRCYLLGLCYWGDYGTNNPTRSISSTINQLKSLLDRNATNPSKQQSNKSNPPQQQAAAASILSVLEAVQQNYQTNISPAIQTAIGKLLVSNLGHNGPLEMQELSYIKQLLGK